MSTVNLPETPSKFSLNELAIVTKTGKLDISKLFQELNIFVPKPILAFLKNFHHSN